MLRAAAGTSPAPAHDNHSNLIELAEASMGSQSKGSRRKFGGLWLALLVAAPLMIAASGGSGWGWIETAGRWFNLAVLVGIIAYFLRVPLQTFLADRKRGIQEDISSAGRALQEAKERLSVVQGQIEGLDEERAAMRKATAEEAEAERLRVLERAQRDVDRLTRRAETEIQLLTRVARNELRSHAADLAVGLARQRLSQELTAEEDARVVGRVVERLHSRN